MKLNKKQLDLKEALEKEWIITNGIGGYSSSTVLGCNTRRYHGLLVAPLKQHRMRHLILSKLDESICINGEKYNLYTNICKNYVSDGYKFQEEFKKEIYPEFIYKVENIKIIKKIVMIYGKNTVLINYTIKNDNFSDAIMSIAPIIHFRDFHNMTPSHNFNVKQDVFEKIKISIDDNIPIYLKCDNGKYIEHKNDNFKNMYYIKEEERGFFAEEDLCVPGIFEIKIDAKKKTEINIMASLDENIDNFEVNQIFVNEEKRINQIIKNTKLISNKSNLNRAEKEKNAFLSDLILATDNFIIERSDFNLHSIIAGYPWFLDWGRDTAISFEGLILVTRRYDLAKDILLLLTKNIKCGLVPNGYSEYDGNPLYNSADASLLLFEAVNKFLKYTKDYDFIKNNIYEILKDIIKNYQNGINLDDNNIYIDKDNLVVSGTPSIQNTWMDAKIGDFVVTPRNGKVVEINSLWYNALKTMENLSKKFDDKELSNFYKKLAKLHQKSFEENFYNPNKKSLYDVLGDDKIRPNQLFSLSTTYPVINPSSYTGKTIFETCKKKLLNKYGLRSLSKDEIGYISEYSGDSMKRDMSYHQGVTWVWLLGLYSDALSNIIDSEKDRIEKEKYIIEQEKLIENVYNTFKKELYKNECIGSISEIYDSEPPYKPGGTIAQAWSVSEVLKIITKQIQK